MVDVLCVCDRSGAVLCVWIVLELYCVFAIVLELYCVFGSFWSCSCVFAIVLELYNMNLYICNLRCSTRTADWPCDLENIFFGSEQKFRPKWCARRSEAHSPTDIFG